MTSELIAGLGAFKIMFDLAKGLKDASDATTRNTVAIELQEKILTAQAAQMTLVGRVSELEEEVARLETWETEKQGYELHEFETGALAYVMKDEARGATTAHYVCTNCFNNGHASILQKETRQPYHTKFLICNRCSSEIIIHGRRSPEHSQPPRRRR